MSEDEHQSLSISNKLTRYASFNTGDGFLVYHLHYKTH